MIKTDIIKDLSTAINNLLITSKKDFLFFMWGIVGKYVLLPLIYIIR